MWLNAQILELLGVENSHNKRFGVFADIVLSLCNYKHGVKFLNGLSYIDFYLQIIGLYLP